MSIVSREKIDDCKEKISFSFDKERIDNVIDDVALNFGKQHKIKGYRKGKAPLEAIKQVAKKYIMDMSKQRLVSEAFEDILFETKWKPFGQPEVHDVVFNTRNFSVDMTIGHIPPFELAKYKEFDLAPVHENMNVETFKEKIKEGVCQEFGDIAVLDEDDFVLLGDEVCVNYVGKIDGEPFENNEGKGVTFIVGTGKALKAFEDEVIGMSIGEKREVTLTFPEDFAQEDVRNKEAVFEVELESARRREAAEFGEDVVKRAGFNTLEAFEQTIELKANEKVAEQEFIHYRAQINEKLIESNEIDVPSWMKVQIAKNSINIQEKKWEEYSEEEQNEFIEDAGKRIKLSFILDKIKEKEVDTVMSNEEVIGTIQANIHRFPQQVREQLASGKNPTLTTQIAAEIQDEYLMRWLINQSVKDSKLQEQTEEKEEPKEEKEVVDATFEEDKEEASDDEAQETN